MHIVIGDAQAVAAEVDALGHIGVADQAHLDFVDEGVAATGTLAPTFTARIRSLRTHLPAKTCLTLSSRAARAGVLILAGLGGDG